MKNPTLCKRAIQFALAVLCVFTMSRASAQSQSERISFGIDGGGNKLYGNAPDNQFWFSGDAFIRWNILNWLSFHVAYNAGQLRFKATPQSGGEIGTLNHVRHGGWQAMLSGNFFPSQAFVPY